MATDNLMHEYATLFPSAITALIGAGNEKFVAKSLVLKRAEKRSDFFLMSKSGKRVILIEVQGYLDAWLRHRMLATMALFSLQHRFRGQMEAAIIFLTEAQRKVSEKFHRQFRGISQLRFAPRVIVLQRLQVQALQSTNNILLAPLYPLCDITPREIERHAEGWANGIRNKSELPLESRDNLLALLVASISHRMKKLNTEEIGEMLGGMKMLDTPVGKEIYRKGELSGEKRGAQHVLVKQASQKFGYMPADLKRRVAAITSTQELDQLAFALLKMQSLAEFRQTLNRLQK